MPGARQYDARNCQYEKYVKGQSQFLTTGDVARWCHVTTNAVKKWIREKNLPAFKTPGGHFRIRVEDFEEFVARYRMPLADALRQARGAKVLVVDDDPDLLSSVVLALSDPGQRLTVSTASDGYEALISIGRLKPDIVILDLKMPRVDGLEVCRQLKTGADTRGIAIVVMTGFPTKANLKKLKEWGVEEVLPKPFSLEALLATVDRLLPGKVSAAAKLTPA